MRSQVQMSQHAHKPWIQKHSPGKPCAKEVKAGTACSVWWPSSLANTMKSFRELISAKIRWRATGKDPQCWLLFSSHIPSRVCAHTWIYYTYVQQRSQGNSFTIQFKVLEEQEVANPSSRWKETLRSKAEINDMETKNNTKNQWSQEWALRKDKIDKLVAKLTTKREISK